MNWSRLWLASACLYAGFCALAAPSNAQMDDVVIETRSLRGNIHMLTGRGGNLAVCVGEDGIFLVDDQYAPLSDKIRAAIATIDDGEVRFVLNTHWHGDHTGGNENLGQTGSLIVAHDEVRRRMSVDNVSTIWNRETEAAAPGALPVVTFSDDVTFHVNGETVHAFHVPHAHTDGDAIVHFVESNVIHMGDVFFHGLYPFIDTDSGGSVDGMIAACDRALEICDPETMLVAGHGEPGTPAQLREYRDMLQTIRDRVHELVVAGRSLEEVQSAAPTAEWDEDWGKTWITGQKFVEILYGDLSD